MEHEFPLEFNLDFRQPYPFSIFIPTHRWMLPRPPTLFAITMPYFSQNELSFSIWTVPWCSLSATLICKTSNNMRLATIFSKYQATVSISAYPSSFGLKIRYLESCQYLGLGLQERNKLTRTRIIAICIWTSSPVAILVTTVSPSLQTKQES